MSAERSYYYLIATLPALVFDREAPWSRPAFIDYSAPWISATDQQVLRAALEGEAALGHHPAGAAWRDWDCGFRNAIVAARAQRLHKDAGTYQHGTAVADGYVRAAVSELVKAEDPLKLERGLDLIRWRYLDELAANHFFDFHVIFSYFQKLGILERWARLDAVAGAAILDGSIERHEAGTERKQEAS